MKRIWFFMICGMLALCTAGSRDTVSSLDRAMVHAVGIDSCGEGVRVTLQIFRPEGAGSDTQLDPAKDNIFVISAEAPTVGEAMTECSGRIGEMLFIGHVQLVVIGSGIRLDDPGRLFAYFVKSKESYLRADIARAENAEELLSAELSEGVVAAQSLVGIIARHEESSDTARCELLTALGASGNTLVMPRLSLTGGEEKTVSAAGAEVYVDGRSSFSLSKEECRGLARFRRKETEFTLTAESKGGSAAVTLEDCSRRVSLTESGGRLSCRFETGVLINNDQSIDLLFDRGALIRSCGERIDRNTARIIALCYEKKADLIGLGELVRCRYPGVWLRCGGDFPSILALTDISCETKVSFYG